MSTAKPPVHSNFASFVWWGRTSSFSCPHLPPPSSSTHSREVPGFVGAPPKALLWTRGGSLALSRVLLGALPALSTRSLGQADPCASGRFLSTEGWEDPFRSHLSVHCGGDAGGMREGKCRRRKLGRKASGPWLGRGWWPPGTQGLWYLSWRFVMVRAPALVFSLPRSPPMASIINRPPSYLILL